MSYFTGPFIGAVGAPGEVHTTQKNPLGAIAIDVNGDWYVYLKGVSSGATNKAVVYDEAGATTLTTTTTVGPVAIMTSTLDAATDFGWCMIKGDRAVSAGDVADNGLVYGTATGGKWDDAAVQGAQVFGAIFRSTDDSTAVTATVQVNFPFQGAYDPST